MFKNKSVAVSTLAFIIVLEAAAIVLCAFVFFPQNPKNVAVYQRPILRETTQVCARLFSGRPDPCWELTPAQTAKLVAMIKAASTTSWFTDKGGLGYDGFNIFFPDVNNLVPENDFILAYVFDGKLSYTKDAFAMADSRAYFDEANPHLIYKQDTNRAIENWLLISGRGKMATDTYQALISESKLVSDIPSP